MRRSSAEESASRLDKAFAGLAVRRRSSRSPSAGHIEYVNSEDDDPKGPLGLNLLHTVDEPVADFVFVHGLGGGSRKTWAKTPDLYHYWPKEWLSRDPEFSNVRVHSFGYKADWNERNDNALGIHDFALSLLGELQINPSIRRSQTRIVLIAHSLGGIIAKKVSW
jgi:pimeloyl-ACP methyl ester carboxylesterase